MKPDLDGLLYAAWWGIRGDEMAKRTLWELVVTDRKRIIIVQLIKRGVRSADADDAHQNIAIKLYKKIRLLRAMRAYPAFEAKFVSEEARRWRELYGHFAAEPVEDVLEQAGGMQ